jgi:hypothetical protein
VCRLTASVFQFYVSTNLHEHGYGCSARTSSLERSIVFQWQDYQLRAMPGYAISTVSTCFRSITILWSFLVRVLGFCTYAWNHFRMQARRASFGEVIQRATPFRLQWFEDVCIEAAGELTQVCS